MASQFLTAIYVFGLLSCGSLNTITMKICFTMSSVGTEGQEHKFQKPWFITFIMFVAMSLALLFDGTIRRCEPCRGGKQLMTPLIADASPGGALAAANSGGMSWSQKVAWVAMPSIFDIVATGLCSMGFLYIPASVWQLLRGAEMLFAAFFAVTLLKRKLQAFQWIGLLFCVVGIISVGLASVWGDESMQRSGKADNSKGVGTLLFGMALALAGQVVQAAQVIAEEWLLKDVELPDMQIVGFEGIWGALAMLAVAFPILYFTPGLDNGRLEDEADSFAMLSGSPPLLTMVLVYTFSCATYNMSGIAVTGALSAVHRVMIEAMRTCIVWAFGLTVHYAYDPSSKFGEVWTPWSWLEVCGFFVLLLGQAVYGEMLRVPGLKYPEAPVEPSKFASPGKMRNLSSPLPPEYGSRACDEPQLQGFA